MSARAARGRNPRGQGERLHFAERDALVLAAMRRCHQDLMRAVDEPEAVPDDPVAQLRARTVLMGSWAHQSTLTQRTGMPFKEELAERTSAVIHRCMDAGVSARSKWHPPGTRRIPQTFAE